MVADIEGGGGRYALVLFCYPTKPRNEGTKSTISSMTLASEYYADAKLNPFLWPKSISLTEALTKHSLLNVSSLNFPDSKLS